VTKRAVIAAVNDYSQQNSLPSGWHVSTLHKCVADALSFGDLLTTGYGFEQPTFLTDQATTRDAIVQAVQDMLVASGAGDVATLFFSGHGGRFPADTANPNRYYESLIPASGRPITDLDLFKLADSLDQSTVNFTIILDSCFSGGLHEGTPDFRSATYTSDFVQTCVSTMDTIIPCGVTLEPGSSALDGNVSNVSGQGNGVVCSVDDNKSLVPLSKSTVVAACRYDETAAELNAHGALTQGLLDLLSQSNPSLTYLDLIDQLRSDMQTLQVTQTPTLLGQQNRASESFLAPWIASK